MKKNNNKANIIIITDVPEKIGRIKEKHGIKTSSNHSIGSWTLFGKDLLIEKVTFEMKETNILKKASEFIEEILKDYREKIPYLIGIFYNDLIVDLKSILYIELIIQNIKKISDKIQVIIVTSNKILNEVKKLFFDLDATKTIYMPSKQKTINVLSFLSRLLYSGSRVTIGILRIIKYGYDIKNTNTILIKYDNYKRIINRFGDPDLEIFEKYLKKKKGEFYYLSYLHTNTNNYKNFLRFCNDTKAIPFELFYIFGYFFFIKKYLLKKPPDLFLYNDKTQIINELLKQYNKRRILIARETSEIILKLFSPHYIFIPAEYSKMPKVLINKAKNEKITTIGIQHGIIHKYHEGYKYPPKIFSEYKTDYFLTYGKAYTQILKDINYHLDTKVITFGNPRFQLISNNLRNDELAQIKRNYKIITITSATPIRQIIKEALLSKVENKIYKYLKKNIYCFIKLHPNQDRFDGFYEKSKEKYPFAKTRIIKSEIDLYQLLYNSDLHVSATSTCIQESLCLGTPTIEIKNLPQPYLFSREFKDYIVGKSLITTEKKDLLINIYKYFQENGSTIKRKEKEQFIENFSIKPDMDYIVSEIFKYKSTQNTSERRI